LSWSDWDPWNPWKRRRSPFESYNDTFTTGLGSPFSGFNRDPWLRERRSWAWESDPLYDRRNRIPCFVCGGSGRCPSCGGRGWRKRPASRRWLGREQDRPGGLGLDDEEICFMCGGSGRCSSCGGSGYTY